MKRIFLASLFALALCSANAARIEWDKVNAVDSEVWDTGPLWDLFGYSDEGAWIEISIIVAPGVFGGLVGSHFLSGAVTIWADQMDKGEIVDYDSMFGRDSSYFYHSTKGSPDVQCDYELIFDEGGLAYLGFAVLAHNTESSRHIDDYPAYGWVELALDPLDAPVVVSSAWDVDGGAMIVGGGAIPEPTSALLLAVGCAFLILRRKRRVA